MIDFTGVTAVAIPEGNVLKIENESGVLWEVPAVGDTTPPVVTVDGTNITGRDENNIIFYVYKDGVHVHTVNQGVNYKRFSIAWLGQSKGYGEYIVEVVDEAGNKTTVSVDVPEP